MATIKNFPNNADEYIGAENVMKWLHGRTSGVFGAEDNLAVTAVADEMAVDVADGLGWLSNVGADGTVFWNDTEATDGAKLRLSVELADAVLPRIDRVVVQWQTTDYVAKPEIVILKGTAAGTPVPPALTNNTLMRQISLSKISIPAGTSKLTAAMVTDERLDSTVCGIVTDSVTVDTTTMQAQFAELLDAIEVELQRLNAGTEVMLKTQYDPSDAGCTFDDVAETKTAIKSATCLLTVAGWAGDAAPYTQSVTVSGMTATWKPGVAVCVPGESVTNDNLIAEREALGMITMIESSTDALTFVCAEDKPTIDITVCVPGVM